MELADFIAKGNLDAALHFLDAIDDTFRFLASNRGAGEQLHVADPKLQGLRVWPVHSFRNYLVFFRPMGDGVAIERVLHGARDIESLFGN
jgi:toxin ParE1/3/4